MTISAKLYLKDLDDAVLHGSAESRERALRYATDMLIVGNYTEEEIWTFGEVIGRLSDVIEIAARARLAKRMATAPNAPRSVVQKLAFDYSIDVAGPVLQHSDRLDADSLIRNIRTRGQPHLLAISKRKSISSEVTDELVTRGNQDVLRSVAANEGARFSDFAFLHAIKRSSNDSILAEGLGIRRDIPRPVFQQLIAKASADVKRKLLQAHPELLDQIQSSVVEVAGILQSKFGPATERYFAAKKLVTAQHRAGALNEATICGYARARKIEEVIVGLSLLSSLPGTAVERALTETETTIILAKAIEFSWETVMAVLFLQAKDHRIKTSDLSSLREQFDQLSVVTPREVLSFFKSHRRAVAAESDDCRLPQLHSA